MVCSRCCGCAAAVPMVSALRWNGVAVIRDGSQSPPQEGSRVPRVSRKAWETFGRRRRRRVNLCLKLGRGNARLRYNTATRMELTPEEWFAELDTHRGAIPLSVLTIGIGKLGGDF